MPAMRRREGDTASEQHYAVTGSNGAEGTALGPVGPTTGEESQGDCPGASEESPLVSNVGDSAAHAVEGSRDIKDVSLTAVRTPGGADGGQVNHHGNQDAEVNDQGNNNTRTGEEQEEAGRDEEGSHVDGEGVAAADADVAGAGAEGPTSEQEEAAGRSDSRNHGNGESAQSRTGDDDPGSVINVEIRPKSVTENHGKTPFTQQSMSQLVERNHTSGVAADIPLAPTSQHTGGPPDVHEGGNSRVANPESGHKKRKKMKKSIFISYSADAGFVERKFVVECVRQFKENNLAEDIWFDKDEKNIDSPCWFSQRLEAAERCRAAVLFLSESYFSCATSVYEVKTLLERYKMDPNAVRIFPVLFSNGEDVDIPRPFSKLAKSCVNLTGTVHIKKSLAEKTSIVVGSLMMDLEKIASVNVPPAPCTPPDTEFTGAYRKKKICHWGANDLQEWLFKLGVKEFYRQSLAESMVDGFLLLATTDQDLVTYLAIDSRIVRKKITQQVLATLEKENKQPDTWHIRAKAQRSRPSTVYLIYDPTDIRLAQNLKHDLAKKGLQVLHHQKLGTSKEEFLQQNGPVMAHASHVLVILTEAATSSPFVFHEVLFAEWLGKKIVTSIFKNTWGTLRASLKAVLGDCPAVDFETKMYAESRDVLEHHIKPLRAVPGVVLEQSYLNKMAEGIKSLSFLANQLRIQGVVADGESAATSARVFISFQWDAASKVEDIRFILESAGFTCWADLGTGAGGTSAGAVGSSTSLAPPVGLAGLAGRGHSGLSNRSGHAGNTSSFHLLHNSISGGGGAGTSAPGASGIGLGDSTSESLTTQIQRNMKASAVVVSCITPKYIQSDNCLKDLTLADSLHKPIVPVLLRFCPWPPEAAPTPVRKILVKYAPVDLSNDKLYRQNMAVLLEKVKRQSGLK